MRKLLIVLTTVTFAAALAGCGSSGGSGGSDPAADKTTTTEAAETTTDPDTPDTTDDAEGDETPTSLDDAVVGLTAEDYRQAIQVNLSDGNEDDGNLVIADGEAECVSAAWIDVATVEVFQASGATLDEIRDPNFGYSDLDLNADQAQEMLDAFDPCGVDIYAMLGMSLTVGLSDEQRACSGEQIDPELANALLLTAFTTELGAGEAEIEAVIGQLTEACDLPG